MKKRLIGSYIDRLKHVTTQDSGVQQPRKRFVAEFARGCQIQSTNHFELQLSY